MNILENISRNITMKFWYCLSGGICIKKDVPLVEFIYLVFTLWPLLLCLCDIFLVLINCPDC